MTEVTCFSDTDSEVLLRAKRIAPESARQLDDLQRMINNKFVSSFIRDKYLGLLDEVLLDEKSDAERIVQVIDTINDFFTRFLNMLNLSDNTIKQTH